MEKLFLNEELELKCPDGLRIMTEEERSKLTFLEEGPGECLSDPEKHMVVTIGWKTAGGLTAALLGQKDVAKSMEAKIRKPMKAYGYKPEGFGDRNIGWKKGSGYRYTYEAQGTGMYGEAYVVKSGKTFYYFNLYTRTETKDRSLSAWEEFLGSALWKKD